jgi:methylenetetrahydrofolate dehydrogenase (NADP+)/methenyltetrahydrofolate cyclohydrolase
MELRGLPVAKAMTEKLLPDIEALKACGIVPRLAVLRLGARPDDLSYEKGIAKCFAEAGCAAESVVLKEDCPQADLECTLLHLNREAGVHGILMLRPLPGQIDARRVGALIASEKDADGMSPQSLGHVLMGDGEAFAPCTAQAVMELLDFYRIPVSGKRVVIVGRSVVVGRPLFALFVARDATPTVCHTKTENLARVCREADILVACAGRPGLIDDSHIGENAVVIDVGINVADGKIVGDVAPKACAAAAHYSPVPGGVGSVTNAVLLAHTVRAAKKLST